jgi:hypothetical protein
MNHPSPPPSQAAYYAALAALQAQLTPATTMLEALALLPAHGFAWYLLPGDVDGGHELRLCHAEGWNVATFADLAGLPLAFAGLVGIPAVLITTATVVERFSDALGKATTGPQGPPTAEPGLVLSVEPRGASPLATAAASLAEATDGTVVEDAEPEDPSHSTEPLSEADRATTLELVKAMTAEQRKAFTIAFRDAFNVPRDARAVAPLILEERHRQFVCRFVDEVEGVPAP